MTDLQRRALARLPLSAANVELLFDAARHPLDGERTPELKIICDLCESHERLRMELEGSTALHDESAKELKKAAEDTVKMLSLLRRLVGNEDTRCRIDHHGYCQEHNYADPCPVPDAQRLTGSGTEYVPTKGTRY